MVSSGSQDEVWRSSRNIEIEVSVTVRLCDWLAKNSMLADVISQSAYISIGSGIAPFFPIPTQPSGLYLPFHLFLFCFRLPILITAALAYLCVLQWLPVSSLGKKACLWSILGTPGIWWYDLKIDGVKKG